MYVCICRKDFGDYAEFCFKTYGDRVKNWMTFNEPRVIAALGYNDGFHAPGRCSKEYGNCTEGNSGTEPYIAAHHLILSHAEAVQRYRQKYLVSTYLFMLAIMLIYACSFLNIYILDHLNQHTSLRKNIQYHFSW